MRGRTRAGRLPETAVQAGEERMAMPGELPESSQSAPALRRVTLPKAPGPFRLNLGWLLVIVTLVAVALGLVFNNLGLLPETIIRWLPLVLLAPAALACIVTLVRRQPRALLGSTALLGAALSLALDAQGVAPLGASLVGVLLITVGTGLLLRGILLRAQPIR